MASNWDISNADWVDAADNALQFIPDPDARGLILYRFEAQYLPALRKARNPQQVTRAWTAFYHYLTLRPTRRKFFSLSDHDAAQTIAHLTAILNLPPYPTDSQSDEQADE